MTGKNSDSMGHSTTVAVKFMYWRKAAAGAALALLAGCSTTGNSFDSSGLTKVVPGQTTLPQAEGLLRAAPVDIYRQRDGSLTARWAQKSTVLADAIYLRKELWLRFDSNGHFERVVDSVNVMAEPAKPTAAQNSAVQAAGPSSAGASNAAGTSGATASPEGLDNVVVSYPLGTQ